MVAFQFTPLVTPKSVLMGMGLNKLSGVSNTNPLVAPKKAIVAASVAKWDARYSHPVPHTQDYYVKCMFGGVLSCGTTHFAVTPLDMAKCNMQVGMIRIMYCYSCSIQCLLFQMLGLGFASPSSFCYTLVNDSVCRTW